jgi:hypothetical protein
MQEALMYMCIGFAIGIAAGSAMNTELLKPLIGDKYQINKPRLKGTNNTLEVIQQNTSNKKQNIFKRILKRNKNVNDNIE